MNETERVITLPRVPRLDKRLNDHAEWIREAVERPGGTLKLRPIQLLMLYEAWIADGGLMLVGVGHGKTVPTLTMSRLFEDVERPLLFVPASARDKTLEEALEYDDHFVIDERLELMTYGALSHPDGETRLRALQPDLIIFDEVHKLKAMQSTRTRKIRKYLSDFPETRVVGLTGTPMASSLADYAHIADWALRDASPLPRGHLDLEAWRLTTEDDDSFGFARRRDWEVMQPLVDTFAPEPIQLLGASGERPPKVEHRRAAVRDAVRERLACTRGVVVTTNQSSDAHLKCYRVEPHELALPDTIRQALALLEDEWERPDGEMLDSALLLHETSVQLASGFHYFWDWPGEPDTDWLDARADWNRAVGEIVRKTRRRVLSPGLIKREVRKTISQVAVMASALTTGGMSSPMVRALVAQHAGGELNAEWDLWYALEPWLEQYRKPTPPQGINWLSDYLVEDVLKRLEGQPPTLIFYGHQATARRLQQAGLETVMADDPTPVNTGDRHLVLSLESHGVALNLQAWTRMIVTMPPASALKIEQLIGRVHRHGQLQECEVIFYAHTAALAARLDKAIKRAELIQRSQGQPQRLLTASWKKEY
jgi:hypothetical protein